MAVVRDLIVKVSGFDNMLAANSDKIVGTICRRRRWYCCCAEEGIYHLSLSSAEEGGEDGQSCNEGSGPIHSEGSIRRKWLLSQLACDLLFRLTNLALRSSVLW
jgi:hypothetical protein